MLGKKYSFHYSKSVRKLIFYFLQTIQNHKAKIKNFTFRIEVAKIACNAHCTLNTFGFIKCVVQIERRELFFYFKEAKEILQNLGLIDNNEAVSSIFLGFYFAFAVVRCKVFEFVAFLKHSNFKKESFLDVLF